MSYRTSLQSGVTIVSVKGPLHENLVQVVSESLGQCKYVLLDLAESDPVIGRDGPVLVRCQQAALAKGGVFGVAAPGVRVALLVQLLGAERTIPLAEEVDAGIEMVKQRSVGRRQETTKTGLDREALVAAAAQEQSGTHRLEEFVHLAIHSLDHVKVLENVLAAGTGSVEPKKAAKEIGATPAGIAEVLSDLESVKIVRSVGGGKYQFDPSPIGRKVLAEILKMWKHPAQRKELIRWVTESHREIQGRAPAAPAEKKGGLLGRFFGK